MSAANRSRERRRVERRGRKSPPFLGPEAGPPKRKPFLVYDIESKADDTQRAGFTRPFAVGAYDPEGREYVSFRDMPHLRERRWNDRHWSPGGCIDRFMRWALDDRFAGHNIFAHNGGSFDHLFLCRWLRFHQDEYAFDIIPVQSAIQALVVWKVGEEEAEGDESTSARKKRKKGKGKRKTWTFLDSVRLFPRSLDELCKTFGIGGKEDHDLHLPEEHEGWESYLKQDCVALAQILHKIHDLVENRLGGEIGMTAPSTALHLLRRRFMGKKRTPKRVPRYQHFDGCTADGGLDPETGEVCRGCCHKWIRKGYYGGRTEMFRDVGHHVRYYDFNSSYAASMSEPVPCGDRLVRRGVIDWKLFKSGKEDGGYGGFAEASVYIPPSCEIPPLPHRNKLTHKLTFPVGYFSGVWSLEELALLADEFVGGEILSVGRVVWFKRLSLFQDMIEELWFLRDKNREGYDEGLSALAKLLFNSTYGKFGMKEEREKIVFSEPLDPKECHLCAQPVEDEQVSLCDRCVGSKPAAGDPDTDVWYQKSVVDAPYVIPHVAAHITATARVRLWRAMKAAVVAGGTVYYTDTDSVITDAILHSSNELGALKDEHPGRTMTFVGVGAKCYAIELDPLPGQAPEPAKVTMKGFTKDLRTKENLVALRKSQLVEKGSACDEGEHTWERLPRPKPKKASEQIVSEHVCAACSTPYADSHARTCASCGWVDANLSRRCEVCGTLDFGRLDKVRSLASKGFTTTPRMREVVKSFRSGYDKRVLMPDGSTRPCYVDERGRRDFTFGEEIEDDEAAE